MSEELSRQDCEELIASAIESLRTGWDVLAKVLAYAFQHEYWDEDGSWEAYCSRTMGLDREFPKALRELLTVAMIEHGMSTRPVAAALGLTKSAVGRLAQSALGRTPAPARKTEPAADDTDSLIEAVRLMHQATNRLAVLKPKSQGGAAQLRVELTFLKGQIESKLAWLDKVEPSLEADPEDEDKFPRRGTMFAKGMDGKFYKR